MANREYTINYYDTDTIYVNGDLYDQKDDLFAGYTDEDDATLLTISIPSDWEGTKSIGLKSDEINTYTELTFDENTAEYELPTQTVGQLRMVLKIVDDNTVITKPIFFYIRNL